MLTLQQLKDMEPDTVFANGLVENSPDGVYMTNSNLGKKLRWAAIRGGYYDWCIVVLWADKSLEEVIANGDKVNSRQDIKKLVPCDDEAFKMYRH